MKADKRLANLLTPRRFPASRVVRDAADEAERKYARFVSHARDCPSCKAAAPEPESSPGGELCRYGLALRDAWDAAERRHAALVEESAPGSFEGPTPRRRPI